MHFWDTVPPGQGSVPQGRDTVPQGRAPSLGAGTLSPRATTLAPRAGTLSPRATTLAPPGQGHCPPGQGSVPQGRDTVPQGRAPSLGAGTLSPRATTLAPRAGTLSPRATTLAPPGQGHLNRLSFQCESVATRDYVSTVPPSLVPRPRPVFRRSCRATEKGVGLGTRLCPPVFSLLIPLTLWLLQVNWCLEIRLFTKCR